SQVITPCDRLDHVSAHHYRWRQVKRLLCDRYDSLTGLASLDRPVLVRAAESDSVVLTRLGKALYNAEAGSTTDGCEDGGTTGSVTSMRHGGKRRSASCSRHPIEI